MAGDEREFEALWAAHSASVLRYAARRVPPGEVDDVVAETFLVAWRRLDAVPDPALPWLLGVARGVAANTTRSANRRTALHERLASTTPASDPAAAWDGWDAESGPALAALARLSASDRELLTLIAWDGLSPAEAAKALGCSRATLAVRLHRARNRLRTHLADAGPDPDPRPDPQTTFINTHDAARAATLRPSSTHREDQR